MKQLFKELQRCLKEGEPSVLVTIVDSSGSTPRGAGSRMLVAADGIRRGTVGGGAVEHKAMEIAIAALKKKESFIQSFSLTRNQTADIGMVCGGDVRICFQYVAPGDLQMEELCAQILQAMDQDRDCWLVLELTDVASWHMGMLQNGSCFGLTFPPLGAKAGQLQLEGRVFYTEPLVQAGTVYIFGGGHVARELVPLLAHLNFRCVVMDDRAEFANPQVFPPGSQNHRRKSGTDFGLCADYREGLCLHYDQRPSVRLLCSKTGASSEAPLHRHHGKPQ